MKTSLIALSVVCVINQSCTIIDYTDKKYKVRRVEQLVKVGDNIRSARSKLIANDFIPPPSYIHSDGSQPIREHYFTVYLRKHTTLDGFSYAAQAELEPWRMGIPKYMTIRSGPDEIIHSIEIHKKK